MKTTQRQRNGKEKSQALQEPPEDRARRSAQSKIIDLFGTVDFDPAYDYKAERLKQRSTALQENARGVRRKMNVPKS